MRRFEGVENTPMFFVQDAQTSFGCIVEKKGEKTALGVIGG